MKKTLLLMAALLLPAVSLTAQKTLNVKDITPALSVYPCGDRHEALVVIRCSEDFTLEFTSNVDKELNIDLTSEGSEKIYNIVLPTMGTGTSYKGRQLVIIAPGFNKVYLPLDLKDKEKYEYLVSDPYSSLRSIYYTSLEDGCKLMQEGAFLEAIDKFKIAKNCPEYNETENSLNHYIEACDSSILWQNEMKRYQKLGQYDKAKMSCGKILAVIPNCSYANNEMQTLNKQFYDMCAYDKEVADTYISNGKLAEARELLQHSIDIESPYASEAAAKIQDINKRLYKSDNHTRSFSYQYATGRPIGFLTTSLKPKGIGGYFSLGINGGIIDLLSQKLEPLASAPDKFTYEAGASIGLSIPVVPKYGWILVSPFGYVGGGYLDNKSDDYWKNVTWYSGLAPELGVAGKIWRITLSYRFQYRYCISKDDKVNQMMGKTGHMFALGICW